MEELLCFSICFYSDSDMSVRIGPLTIDSASTDELGWGTFQVGLDFDKYKKLYLWCSYHEELDPYKMKTTGFSYPEWVIEIFNFNVKKKQIWSSTPMMIGVWDFYNNIKKKFINK
jgi:hypothetical protein